MDISEIKELLLLFDASSLAYFRWERGDERLVLRKTPRASEATVLPSGGGPAGVVSYPEVKNREFWEEEGVASEHGRPSELLEPSEITAEEAFEGLESVRAPLVGTFYSRPEPTAPSFVRVGDRVTPDTVVCLIEAMKIFNEIKAGVHGIVHAVLAEDGQLVEYGQPLFLIRKEG